MIHLFHGEQVEASRRELRLLRDRFKDREIVQLNGKTITTTELIQATESTSLFGTDRLVIIENLLAKKLSGRVKVALAEEWGAIIAKIPDSAEIVFWEEKEMGKTVLNLFPKTADIALFRPDRSLFKFVENLRPGGGSALLELFERTQEIDAPELIFTMLVRQFHYLLLIKDAGKQAVDLTPWQIGKISRQAELFSSSQIRKLYRDLLTVDTKIKTSTSAFDLTQELKLFLIGM